MGIVLSLHANLKSFTKYLKGTRDQRIARELLLPTEIQPFEAIK